MVRALAVGVGVLVVLAVVAWYAFLGAMVAEAFSPCTTVVTAEDLGDVSRRPATRVKHEVGDGHCLAEYQRPEGTVAVVEVQWPSSQVTRQRTCGELLGRTVVERAEPIDSPGEKGLLAGSNGGDQQLACFQHKGVAVKVSVPVKFFDLDGTRSLFRRLKDQQREQAVAGLAR